MKKPTFQWCTRGHRARRLDALPPGRSWGPRAEAFALVAPREAAGESASPRVVLDLDRQQVSGAWVASITEVERDDLAFAVRAWLVARGRRNVALHTDEGEPLDVGPISVSAFDDRRGGDTVITLCPSNAEMVDALGAFARVIACEASSDHPPEVERLERLGPDLDPDLDRVAALAPGLVVSSLSVPGMERIVTGLRARGVPQVVLAPRSLDDVRDELVRLGAALGVPERAVEAVERFDAERAALDRTRPETPTRVYLEWWPRPMFTPGGACYSNELIALAGGVNVFGDSEASSVEISPEELVAAEPDVCFVSWCGAPLEKLDPRRLIERPGLEALPAARAGRVFTLDERFSGRPGPRVLEAARIMRAAIDTVGAPGRSDAP